MTKPTTQTTQEKLISELFKLACALSDDTDLFALHGSYKDTLTDEEVLELLLAYNTEGKIFHAKMSVIHF